MITKPFFFLLILIFIIIYYETHETDEIHEGFSRYDNPYYYNWINARGYDIRYPEWRQIVPRGHYNSVFRREIDDKILYDPYTPPRRSDLIYNYNIPRYTPYYIKNRKWRNGTDSQMSCLANGGSIGVNQNGFIQCCSRGVCDIPFSVLGVVVPINTKSELKEANKNFQLYGREKYIRSGLWDYYVIDPKTNMKYDVYREGKELFDGDVVKIRQLENDYRVSLYKSLEFTYNPFI